MSENDKSGTLKSLSVKYLSIDGCHKAISMGVFLAVMAIVFITLGGIAVLVLILPTLGLMVMSAVDDRFFKKGLGWSGLFGKIVSKLGL